VSGEDATEQRAVMATGGPVLLVYKSAVYAKPASGVGATSHGQPSVQRECVTILKGRAVVRLISIAGAIALGRYTRWHRKNTAPFIMASAEMFLKNR